ncbi:MAG: UDP-N-acetylmuramoyl-tripeptide--D-alanyl-D-alanine ligase [Gemmatimonadota bacterium]
MTTFTWTEARVREALDLPRESEKPGTVERHFSGVSTDSRTVEPGALLVALKGPRFDAHDFVAAALESGATGAVVDRALPGVDPALLFQVPDTLKALGKLASFRRRALPARVVGITGSVGKTTTKELLRGALEGALSVHVTAANLNNRVGVPLTLLSAPAHADVVVVEMGTSEPGEMGVLSRIALPDLGVITAVAESHIEGLGSLEGVFTEKLALMEGMPPQAPMVVGDTPPELAIRARATGRPVSVAGWGSVADPHLRPLDVRPLAKGTLGFEWQGIRVNSSVPGRHGVSCALLALEVARQMGVEPRVAARGLAHVAPPPLRGEFQEVAGLTLILDCYNAGPESVREAAEILAAQEGRTRVAFLGSMRELGHLEAPRHLETLKAVLELGVERVVATGAFAEAAAQLPAPTRSHPGLLVEADPDAAYLALRPLLAGDEVVLLKASRGIRLERLIPRFEDDFQRPAPTPAGEGR